MTITNVKNPTYNKYGSIDCIVTIVGIGDVPFTASPNDSEVHGREVFQRVVNGEFGEISPYIAPIEVVQVPQILTPRQARLALNSVGLLDAVEAAVATNKEYQIFWEYSLEIKRDDNILNTMAAALGMTERQVDDLFIAASKL